MKIYKNKNLTEEVIELNLGIVEAGDSKIFTYYIKNDSDAELTNLNFSVDHKEVKVIEFPNILSKQTSAELKIEWKPSITLKEGLHTKLLISGIELWG